MPEWNTGELIAADKRFVWHPFTDMREWCAPEHERLVLVEGRGALLRDSNGREYIDGNSSIWQTSMATITRTSTRLSAVSSAAWRTLHFSAV